LQNISREVLNNDIQRVLNRERGLLQSAQNYYLGGSGNGDKQKAITYTPGGGSGATGYSSDFSDFSDMD
jgi:hypothetical protein